MEISRDKAVKGETGMYFPARINLIGLWQQAYFIVSNAWGKYWNDGSLIIELDCLENYIYLQKT